METLNLRPYDPQKDEPIDEKGFYNIAIALDDGEQLHVDQHGRVWVIGQMVYVGKIKRR